MVKTPRVNINLQNIEENARILKERCRVRGIELTGVVKGAAGDLRVAEAFVKGGIKSLGDSRLQNIIALREAGFQEELVLLRLPQLTEVDEVVRFADVSLISEVETIQALSEAAVKTEKRHKVIVMVDVGDLREGVLPEDLEGFFARIIDLPGIEIKGIGTNVGCYGGVLPSRENTEILLDLREKLEKTFPLKLPLISGGNTATTILLDDDRLPEGINHLRVGEGILQGTDITNQRLIVGLNHNNFVLTARIIELKEKPSVPKGKIGHDAFGNVPEYPDRGNRLRAILAVGRQDIKLDGLTPLLENAEILGASSDHLILDVTDVAEELKVGDEIDFYLDYGAMLRAMTSPYVYKHYLE